MFRLLPPIAPVVRIVRCVGCWQDRYRQRRALIALSDRALHDIGLSRADAWGEHAKPFWRS